MFNKLLTGLLCTALLLPAAATADEVNVYSARKEKLIKPLLDQFTAATGIKVNLLTGKADALLKKLELEGENTPADLLITTDAGRLHRAQQAGVLQPVDSATLMAHIPLNMRDPEHYWFGLTYRARPIMYVKARVSPDELSTYEALTDETWKGRICIRSSSNIYNQSLVASMLASQSAEQTQDWANGLVQNFARPPKGGDRDQIKAAAAGQCDIAIANSYYYAAMLAGSDEAQRASAEKLAIFWPNQGADARGTHINISGAAVTKAAKHKDNAIKLLEYMTQDEAQRWYSDVNGEYPVKVGVAANELLQSWGEFKADTLNLSELGTHNAEALRIMDKAGWR